MFTTVYAADAAVASETAGGGWSSWLIMIAMFAILYFVMIRPQNKRDKETKEMRNSLKPGDEIVTIGGIVGTVARVKEDSDTIVIMVGSDRTKLEILKSAISDKRSKDTVSSKSGKSAKEEAPAEETSAKPNKKNIKKLGAKEEPKAAEAPAEEAKAEPVEEAKPAEAPAEEAK